MDPGEEMPDLFAKEEPPGKGSLASAGSTPLADRARPQRLDQLFGQKHLLGEGSFLPAVISADEVPSMILWGPPGCGKTSLAQVIASCTNAVFVSFSAVLGGLKDVREIVAAAKVRRARGERTILFVDEIHRFNKGQQDAFLPHVEQGIVTLIGATTENPSFALNGALLSRCRVIRLKPLAKDELTRLLQAVLKDEGCGIAGMGISVTAAFLEGLADVADGDARRALNGLEQAVEWAKLKGDQLLDEATLAAVFGDERIMRHDKAGDAHFDLVSALIKSMRGSDPDAALYYAARMVEVGEDPRFILRRILIFASEDVGNADPRALQIALAASQAYERLGMPEGALCMAQAITYCACAPKSNASYAGWKAAVAEARSSGALEIPMHLRNAPTQLMKSMGYGEGYHNPHDAPGHFLKVSNRPPEIQEHVYYRPSDQGYEQRIAERMRRWWDNAKSSESHGGG
jgi:putative ATPase